jgi:hypothetical protein
LGFDGRDDARMAKPNLVDVVAMEVEIAPAFDIFDPGPVSGAQDVEAGGGHGLVDEPVRILFKKALRLCVEVRFRPCLAIRRKIDVAFDAQCGR